jgi:serine/threonine protein kinase
MSPVDHNGFDEVAAAFSQTRRWQVYGYAGGGAFKHVYRVDRPQTGDTVALKIVKGKSPRTVREVETLKRCNHPNISKLYDHGSFTHNAVEYDFTVEEFLSGGTLADRVPTGTTFGRAETVALGAGLIDALCHVTPIVHRDIKPLNIMFRALEGAPVLVDFGLARNPEDSSLTPTWAARGPGTPYYAAPEQLNNEKEMIDWRTDQFSLGVVLSIVHLGVHPYQLNNSPVPDPSTVDTVADRLPWRADLPDRCQAARLPCILKMVKPWPVERYRAPRQLLEAWRQQGNT